MRDKWSIHLLCILALILLIAACAPLQYHDSAWGTAGEVALRVVGCPLTLCFSELGLAMDHERKRQQADYNNWYWSLSPEERDRADRREAARLQALGLALSGGGPFQRHQSFSVPTYQPYQNFQNNFQPLPLTRPQPPVSCTSRATGPMVYTDCY